MTKIYTRPFSDDIYSVRRYRERLEQDPTDEHAKLMIEFRNAFERNKREEENTPEWQANNLEFDLRTSEYIKQKCEAHEYYAQNLYAALCNNVFRKNDIIPILLEQTWTCSWRHAGGIVADILERGDYIDWYLSGMRMNDPYNPDASEVPYMYAHEGEVTDEIRNDLLQLNWLVVLEDDGEY